MDLAAVGPHPSLTLPNPMEVIAAHLPKFARGLAGQQTLRNRDPPSAGPGLCETGMLPGWPRRRHSPTEATVECHAVGSRRPLTFEAPSCIPFPCHRHMPCASIMATWKPWPASPTEGKGSPSSIWTFRIYGLCCLHAAINVSML